MSNCLRVVHLKNNKYGIIEKQAQSSQCTLHIVGTDERIKWDGNRMWDLSGMVKIVPDAENKEALLTYAKNNGYKRLMYIDDYTCKKYGAISSMDIFKK